MSSNFQSQVAFRTQHQFILGRLTVNHVAAAGGMQVRFARAVAGGFLPNQEEQAEVRHVLAQQAFRRRNLCGDDALGVACSPPVNQLSVLARGNERRNSVDVRAQDHVRLSNSCVDIGTVARDRLEHNFEVSPGEVRPQVLCASALVAGDRFNVD